MAAAIVAGGAAVLAGLAEFANYYLRGTGRGDRFHDAITEAGRGGGQLVGARTNTQIINAAHRTFAIGAGILAQHYAGTRLASMMYRLQTHIEQQVHDYFGRHIAGMRDSLNNVYGQFQQQIAAPTSRFGNLPTLPPGTAGGQLQLGPPNTDSFQGIVMTDPNIQVGPTRS